MESVEEEVYTWKLHGGINEDWDYEDFDFHDAAGNPSWGTWADPKPERKKDEKPIDTWEKRSDKRLAAIHAGRSPGKSLATFNELYNVDRVIDVDRTIREYITERKAA